MKNKLYSTCRLILAVLLVAALSNLIPRISAGSHIHERFAIEPFDADYDIEAQTFTLLYHVHDDVVEADIDTSLWGFECQDGGIELNTTDPGIQSISTTLDHDNGQVAFVFQLDLQGLKTNTDVFQHFPVLKTMELKLCARFGLSVTYGSTTREMNILETQFILDFDVSSGGFEIEAFRVGPKEREITTQNKTYDAIGYLCDRDNPTVELTDVLFNQGSVISVCVTPTPEALADDIRMESIESFTWRQHAPVFLEQIAVINGAESSNYLTVLECVPGAIICIISSVLYAEYYRIPLPEGNYVEGSGVAHLMFNPNRRRLAQHERYLQENNVDEPKDFDLVVQNVIPQDDRPPLLASDAGDAWSGVLLFIISFLLNYAILLA